jgi:hypothetical protein
MKWLARVSHLDKTLSYRLCCLCLEAERNKYVGCKNALLRIFLKQIRSKAVYQ